MATSVANIRRLTQAELDRRGIARVDRGSWWGNPFTVEKHGRAAMRLYLDWLENSVEGWLRVLRVRELRGKTLGCWCAPGPCHAYVLARLADGQSLADVRAWMLLWVEGPEQRELFA